MGEGAGQGMVAFLGVPADRELLDPGRDALPQAERFREPAISTHEHDRLVAAGSALTGITLVAGAAMALYFGWRVLFESHGAIDVLFALVGIVLAGTHWGWVHVAEYAGLGIDERRERALEHRRRDWLASVAPYPRFSVSTRVLDDASTVVERALHRPVGTGRGTFTFVREIDAQQAFDVHASAEAIATAVETMRREARLETDRMEELWEAASTAYEAALVDERDDVQHLAAQRAAATALSEHINRSLLEPPLVE
jgi:hypothetical protein